MLIPICATVVTLSLGHGAAATDNPGIDDSFRPALPVIADREVRLTRPPNERPDAMGTSLFDKSIDIEATKPGSVQHAQGTWNPTLFP
jgi:hypothetical protein